MLHEKPIRIKDVDAAAWRCPRSGTFACNPVLLSKRIQSGKVLGQTVIMRSDHTSKGIRESEASAQVEHFWTLWSNARHVFALLTTPVKLLIPAEIQCHKQSLGWYPEHSPSDIGMTLICCHRKCVPVIDKAATRYQKALTINSRTPQNKLGGHVTKPKTFGQKNGKSVDLVRVTDIPQCQPTSSLTSCTKNIRTVTWHRIILFRLHGDTAPLPIFGVPSTLCQRSLPKPRTSTIPIRIQSSHPNPGLPSQYFAIVVKTLGRPSFSENLWFHHYSTAFKPHDAEASGPYGAATADLKGPLLRYVMWRAAVASRYQNFTVFAESALRLSGILDFSSAWIQGRSNWKISRAFLHANVKRQAAAVRCQHTSLEQLLA
ncbi:uncharacterized protein BT62DRAFT_1005465 [Guyanagaster necrorhizus]|uniref:Uncharacterized protein n=1 Tax=Guyanagaster necrorhizus TaxID=856835 RepID=A0A9P7VV72_9AGAR|nr:uncharacterized protein BT62DRAFT_1005465 [Guyanagaster necrorhizus MCA 3950]KAG7447060.1 hypothetical protein BT62DRAFT_1005465 [Guyanagaster necrorhizus MCA 3950]